MIRIEKEVGRLDLAPQLIEILDDVYGQSPWTLEQVLADLGQAQNWYALAYSGEELVGFLAMQENLYELEVVQIFLRLKACKELPTTILWMMRYIVNRPINLTS